MSGNSLHSHDQLMDGLLGDFLDESTGLLQQLNNDLLRLDELIKASVEPPEPVLHQDLLNEMFRAAHSLKGLSGMMRFDNVNGLTHKVENIFDAARGGTLPLTSEVVDLVFQAVDRLEAMIGLLSDPNGGDVEYRDVQTSIESLLQRSGSLKPAVAQPVDIQELQAASASLPGDAAESEAPLVAVDDSLTTIDDDQDIPEKYIAIFIDETDQTLEELSEMLLSGGGVETVEPMLTTCHRLKGSAASIGLHRLAHVAHRMEDLLQDLRNKKCHVEGRLTDAMLANVDAIRAFVGGLRCGQANDVLEVPFQLLQSVVRELRSASLAGSPANKRDCATANWSTVRQAAPAGRAGFLGRVVFAPHLDLVSLKASLLLEKLQHLGEVFHSAPSAEALEGCGALEELVFGVATDSSAELLRMGLMIQGVLEVELESLGGLASVSDGTAVAGLATEQSEPTLAPEPHRTAETDKPPQANAGAAGAPAGKGKPVETLRVDIDRLDQLMSLAGQLVINKARFSQIGSQLKGLSNFKSSLHCATAASNTASRLASVIQDAGQLAHTLDTNDLRALTAKLCDDLQQLQKDLGELTKVRGAVNELTEAVHQLGRVSDGIQTTVMDTRMVPIGPLFTRFKRVVRDLSRDNHKQIELKISGESTELDKRMIDELGDPLIHLIRNSADHGVEPPEQRLAAGKSAHGTITLNAFQRGNRIVIQIDDDGRGLDAGRIRDKARAKGLITDAEAERMTPQQLHQLIWKPGFSTAERITEVSGRGMGMDIVLSKIEQLNGTIDVVSEPGEGTRFEIKLPLTMAIVPSLLTVVDNEVFAIPVESIVEIVQVPSEALPTIQGRTTARVRDRITSVVELHELFAWDLGSKGGAVERTVKTLVVVGNDGKELALAVDDLLGEQDVVIKSLEENFQNVEGIAGASILGDGRVSLILDVSALLTMARRATMTQIESQELADRAVAVSN